MAVPGAQYDSGHLRVFFSTNEVQQRDAERLITTAWQIEESFFCADGKPGLTTADYHVGTAREVNLQQVRSEYLAGLARGEARWRSQYARWAPSLGEGLRATYLPERRDALTIVQLHHLVGRNAMRYVLERAWIEGVALPPKMHVETDVRWQENHAPFLSMRVYVSRDGEATQGDAVPTEVQEQISDRVDGVLLAFLRLGITVAVSSERLANADRQTRVDPHGVLRREHGYAYRIQLYPPGRCE